MMYHASLKLLFSDITNKFCILVWQKKELRLFSPKAVYANPAFFDNCLPLICFLSFIVEARSPHNG